MGECTGVDYVTVVTVNGAVDPMSGSSTGLVKNVTSLLFVSLSGDVLAILPLTEVETLATYVVETRIPTTGLTTESTPVI